MKFLLQGFILYSGLIVFSWAQSSLGDDQERYKAPKVADAVFLHGVTMLDSEKDEYAGNLSAYGVKTILDKPQSPVALEHGRRVLALALHLSPRNRKAVVANFQLSRGLLPKPQISDYSAKVFSRLLVTRGELLYEEGGEKNVLLARAFVSLAAEMDPLNEDAVYKAEMQKIDYEPFNWKLFTGE